MPVQYQDHVEVLITVITYVGKSEDDLTTEYRAYVAGELKIVANSLKLLGEELVKLVPVDAFAGGERITA